MSSEIPGAMKKISAFRKQLTLQYVRFLPDTVLLVAIGLGVYTLWSYTEEQAISLIALLALFVFAIACALRYYFSFVQLGSALYHTWVGCLVGIISFWNGAEIEFVTTQEVMEALFLTSLILTVFWNVLERFLKREKQEATLLPASEGLESLGLLAASFVTGTNAVAISILIVAFVLHLVALRMKSFLVIFSLAGFVVVSALVFFPDLHLKPNQYALLCFVGRHISQPILDFYFSRITVIEQWRSFFNLSRILRHLCVLLVFLLDLTLAALIGERSRTHKEWFVVVPIFAAFAILWLVLHLLNFLTCWKLMSKITECNASFQAVTDERQTYSRILEARGIRHYSILSQRIIFLALVSTVILLGIGWTTRTPYTIALLFMLLPLHCMTVSLFWSFGSKLGGTCTGYAVIAPVTCTSPSRTAKLLPPASVQESANKAAGLLAQMQRFFAFHMIDNYGCDYSTSGLAADHLETKLKAFFSQRTVDGPRYDTYVLYHSGNVHENGDWALVEDKTLGLDTLMEWWAAHNSGSRLVLVLDTSHSCLWLKPVRAVRGQFVALQTCQYFRQADPEAGGSSTQALVGRFTQDWVDYSLGAQPDLDWGDRERPVRPVYSVSRHWSDFSFHLPTAEDFDQHWDSNFPRLTKPLIKAVNLPSIGVLCCCCHAVLRCLKRKQMKWLPPKEIDTGHGFKLIKA